MKEAYKQIEPISKEELDCYYRLRWEVLRKPLGVKNEMEIDDNDSFTFHRMIIDSNNFPISVGRIHFISQVEAQIRFMAVIEQFQGKGFGTKMIKILESIAISSGITSIILHAREDAITFYERNGYCIVKKTHLLFNSIQHFLMNKKL